MGSQEGSRAIHFLVVDDDADSRATVVEYLRVIGFHRVTLAHNGTDAIRLLDRDPSINFIISDWDMPMMNGLSLLRRIKTSPSRTHIPFLVMTSPISKETEKVVLAAENLVDGYLIKPFRSQLLQDKIHKILTVSTLGPNKKVVVVDDDVDAREAIVDYLKQIGFKTVMSFSEGVSAFEYIKNSAEEVGLIISDWEMPQMTGIEFLRLCKSVAALKEIPFLMVTSQSSIERMKIIQAAQANVDQYMLKPFDLQSFKHKVVTVIETSKKDLEIRKLVHEGIEFLENGHYQNAFLKFEETLKIQPNHEAALRGMAEAASFVKGIQAALPFFRKAIDANPLYPKTYLQLAHVYEKMNQVDKAVALLDSANRHIGFNSDLHFALGRLYFKARLFDEAEKEFDTTLQIKPDHPEAKLYLQKLGLQRKGNK